MKYVLNYNRNQSVSPRANKITRETVQSFSHPEPKGNPISVRCKSANPKSAPRTDNEFLPTGQKRVLRKPHTNYNYKTKRHLPWSWGSNLRPCRQSRSVPGQARFCTSEGQCLPPFCGRCRIVLLREAIPGPQVESHLDHGLHSLTMQSITAKNREKWNGEFVKEL